MKHSVNPRIKNIYGNLKRTGLDCLIVTSSANISYLTNFISRESYLLISKRGNVYITDSRYIEDAKRHMGGIAVIKQTDGSAFKIMADYLASFNFRYIGFEEKNLSFALHKKFKERLGKRIRVIPTCNIIEKLRQIKESGEIEKIKKAVQITIMALKFIKNFISIGKKEIEIAGEIERFIRYKGAYGASFDIIVASGPNSSFPHHVTSQRKIKKNEPVLIDIGVDYLGYKSDLTRVFFSAKINHNIKKIYDIVTKAQEEAIKKIKPAVAIRTIDTAARQYITQKGYGGFFGHNLGHGIGLEVHEEPRISPKARNRLEEGMVFTIEPGIYIPGEFGIRIEDMVLVTQKGCEVLSGLVDK